MAAPFGWRCLTGPTVLRFQTPLIEPDGRVSRIRLSEKASRRRPREVARPPLEAGQPQHLVQVHVRVSGPALSLVRVLRAQPLTRLPLRVSRVYAGSLFQARRRHYPGRTTRFRSLTAPRGVGLPRVTDGSAPALKVSRPARRSLALRPACSRSPQGTLSIEGFDGFVASAAAPIATGWLPAGATHLPGGFRTR